MTLRLYFHFTASRRNGNSKKCKRMGLKILHKFYFEFVIICYTLNAVLARCLLVCR